MKSGGDKGTIINPRKSPATCFQCHLEVKAKFDLPHHHPVLEGKVSCADCHNPHKGDAVKGGGTNLPQSLKGGGTALLGHNETCGYSGRFVRFGAGSSASARPVKRCAPDRIELTRSVDG